MRKWLIAVLFLISFAGSAGATTCSCPSPPTDQYGAQVCTYAPCTYYRLDDTSGSTAAQTSQSATGTYTGGFTLNQTGPILTRGGSLAVALNGSSGYVDIFDTGVNIPGQGPAPNNGQVFAAVIWVKPASFTFASLTTQEDPGSVTLNGWAVYSCTTGACGGSNGYAFWMYKANDTSCGHTASVGGGGTGTWHMLTVITVGNGTELASGTIYVDRGATSDAQNTFSGCHYGSTLQRRLGANSVAGAGYFFNGNIAEYATFGSNVTSVTQVQVLYDKATVSSNVGHFPWTVKRPELPLMMDDGYIAQAVARGYNTGQISSKEIEPQLLNVGYPTFMVMPPGYVGR